MYVSEHRGPQRSLLTTRGSVRGRRVGRSLERRPGLAAVESGRASGLVVAKLDRLSRSLLDFASLMERSRREGWSLIALDLGVDTSTPQGELMAPVLATFVQFERRLIGQRTKAALAELRAQGVTLGRPRSIDDEAIARAVRLRGDGLTWRAVADQLNAEGVPAGRNGLSRRDLWKAVGAGIVGAGKTRANRCIARSNTSPPNARFDHLPGAEREGFRFPARSRPIRWHFVSGQRCYTVTSTVTTRLLAPSVVVQDRQSSDTDAIVRGE